MIRDSPNRIEHETSHRSATGPAVAARPLFMHSPLLPLRPRDRSRSEVERHSQAAKNFGDSGSEDQNLCTHRVSVVLDQIVEFVAVIARSVWREKSSSRKEREPHWAEGNDICRPKVSFPYC